MLQRALPFVGCVVVAVTLVSAGAARPRDVSAIPAATLASLTTSDVRVVVSARKLSGGGGALPAAVIVTTSERTGGAWRRTGAHRLPDTYFWKVLTGPRAVCRLELRTRSAQPRVVVRLLQSPSLGCGPASSFAL